MTRISQLKAGVYGLSKYHSGQILVSANIRENWDLTPVLVNILAALFILYRSRYKVMNDIADFPGRNLPHAPGT